LFAYSAIEYVSAEIFNERLADWQTAVHGTEGLDRVEEGWVGRKTNKSVHAAVVDPRINDALIDINSR
jgi:hypothetical protein